MTDPHPIKKISADRPFELAVIILNYRTPKAVIDCATSLFTTPFCDTWRLVIVDNFSNDQSVQALQKWRNDHPFKDHINLVVSPMNGGFSAGINLGVQSINADYYLLLNSDTLMRSGAIHPLLKAAKSDETAGLIAPRLEAIDGSAQISCFRKLHPVTELIEAAATGPLTHLFSQYDTAAAGPGHGPGPDWASFAAILIKQEVFKRIGLLDTHYFMYFEDVEFCSRARSAGFKIYICPDARFVHFRGASSPVKELKRSGKRLPRYFYASRSRYYYQTYGRIGLLCANIFRLIGITINILRSSIGNSVRLTCEKEARDIWTNWRRPLVTNHPLDTQDTADHLTSSDQWEKE